MSSEDIADIFLAPKLRELEKIAPLVNIGTPKDVVEQVELLNNSKRRVLTKDEISHLFHSKNISIYSVYKPIQWQCLI